MPSHVALAHLALLTGPLAALTALGYAVWPAQRGVLRWVTVALALLTTTLVVVAGQAGKELIDELTRAGASDTELLAAEDHAKNADTILVCSVSLVVLGTLSTLRRFRGRWTTTAVGLVGLAMLVALWYTVTSGAEAVWLGRGW